MRKKRPTHTDNLNEPDLGPPSTAAAETRADGMIWLIRGTRRDDDIQGLERSEKIVGLGGDDTIDAGGGRDILLGGAGNDILNGMDGEDLLYGGDGDDNLFGGGGMDTLFGGIGDDYLSGGGNDFLFGDGGNDTFSLSKRDWAAGGAGDDTFRINDKGALVHGGIGVDTIKFNRQIKQFAFVYQEDGLLVRYTEASGGSPVPSALADGEIEKLAFGKGMVIDRREVSTPQIRSVWNGAEHVPLDRIVTTEVYEIRGTADPGARVTIMLGDTVFRTVVTDHTGQWRVRELDPLTLPETMHFTAVADFGLAGHAATSQTVEIHSPLRLQNFSDAHGIVFDGADNRYASDLTVSLGDVNGDGVDDIAVVSADRRIAVIYGGQGLKTATGHVGSLQPAEGYAVDLEARAVYGIGDINGDGRADFAVVNDAYPTEISIIFGAATGRSIFTAAQRDGTGGFVLRSEGYYDLGDVRLASAGDINGDGIDDLLVGTPNTSSPLVPNSGKAYILFGGSTLHQFMDNGTAVTRLDDLAPTEGFAITTTVERNYMGREVSSAGDINGDGYDDVIISSTRLDGLVNKATSYVVFGGADGFGKLVNGHAEVDLPTLAASDGFALRGNTSGNSELSTIGDFNGDGIDDIFVNTGAWVSGDVAQGYIVFGKTGQFGTITDGRARLDLATMKAEDGIIVTGGVGGNVSAIGDFNGDGFDDFVMHDDFFTYGKRVHIIFGTDGALGEAVGGQRLLDIKNAESLTIDSTAVASSLNATSYAARGAGDVNGDGFDDVMVTLEPDWWSDVAARTYIFYGHEI